MIDLDKRDRDILYVLSLNGRASLREIAKKTRLSKEVVHYRIKKLEEKGVIEGFYAVVNVYEMGRTFYRVYMKTRNMTKKIEKEFLEYLQKEKKVTWVVEMDGSLDFLYTVWAENISIFQKTYRKINERFGKYIEEKSFSVMTDVFYFKYGYLNGKKDSHFLKTGGEISSQEIKEEELALITLVSHFGRMPIIELANKLGSSAKTVQKRMKSLEQRKIITGYNVKINHKLLGFTQRKVMLKLNDTSKKTLQSLINFLHNHPLCIYITIAIGEYDLEFEMMEKSHMDFHDMLKELKNHFGEEVKQYFTVIFYNEPKVGQL